MQKIKASSLARNCFYHKSKFQKLPKTLVGTRYNIMFSGIVEKLKETRTNKNLQGGKARFKYLGEFMLRPIIGQRFIFNSKLMPRGGLSTSPVKEIISDTDTEFIFRTMSGTIYRVTAIRGTPHVQQDRKVIVWF